MSGASDILSRLGRGLLDLLQLIGDELLGGVDPITSILTIVGVGIFAIVFSVSGYVVLRSVLAATQR